MCKKNISCFVLSRLSRVWAFATPRTVAHGLLCPWDFPGKSTGVGAMLPPGDLPDPRIRAEALMFLALAGRFFTTSAPGKKTCARRTFHINFWFSYVPNLQSRRFAREYVTSLHTFDKLILILAVKVSRRLKKWLENSTLDDLGWNHTYCFVFLLG